MNTEEIFFVGTSLHQNSPKSQKMSQINQKIGQILSNWDFFVFKMIEYR